MKTTKGKGNRVEKPKQFRKTQKAVHGSSNLRSKATLKAVPLESLPWQKVALPERLEDAEGFFGLDEIENVQIVRDEESGRLQYQVATESRDVPPVNGDASYKIGEHPGSSENSDWQGFSDDATLDTKPGLEKSASKSRTKGKQENQELKDKKKSKRRDGTKKAVQTQNGSGFAVLEDSEDDGVDVSAWNELHLSPITLLSLAKLRFQRPTPIQSAAIPQIRSGHDVIGKASTGSGKTLAFGIPILEHFLATDLEERPAPTSPGRQHPPVAMILSPTRELAHQLGEHLNQLCSRITPRSPRIVTITGGLSLYKQQRLLATADIIIGTPGRLWEIVGSMAGLLKWLRKIKFLVLDEADRLLSEGHFKEIEEILNSLDREDVADGDLDFEADQRSVASERQTLVFSATFEKDLQRKLAGKGRAISEDAVGKQESMGYLLDKLNFRAKPMFIDVNPISQMASNLKEGLIECAALEKDLYLYTVLLHYPNMRTLVFANSISSVRRLAPFLQDLGLPALALHSQMPQKARLRSIERFSSSSNPSCNSILVATDVAARGLDIPSVELVIHYHAPRAADMYVHRSGRTARANKAGSSILLCAPEEVVPVRRLIAKVHARKATTESKNFYIRTLDLDRRVAARLKPRVSLAKEISDSTLAKEKRGHEENWLRNAADDLGVDYDDEEFAANEGSAKGRGMGRKKKLKDASELSKQELGAMRAQLKGLLSHRINVGVSENYLTAGGMDVDELLKGEGGNFLGRVDPLDFK